MRQVPRLSYSTPEDPLLKSVLIQSIEHLTGKRKLEKLYAQLLDESDTGSTDSTFWATALSLLELKLDYNKAQLAKFPQQGPIVFIANHPFGLMDGLIMCHLGEKTRGPKFRILINSALCREERVESYFLPIDFSETKEAVRLNINTKKQSIELLRQGGAIVIFPGGGISTSTGPFGQATDLEWKLFVTKLIQMTQATVIPVYFYGQNSRMFQIASQVSLTLRLSLIIREVNKKIGKTIRFSIGDPIQYQDLADIKERRKLLAHLREVTYSLAES